MVGAGARMKRDPACWAERRGGGDDAFATLATELRALGGLSTAGACGWVEQIEQCFPETAHGGMLCGDGLGCNAGRFVAGSDRLSWRHALSDLQAASPLVEASMR